MRIDDFGKNNDEKPLIYVLRFTLGILIEAAAVGLLMGIGLFITGAGF